jgi:hypothetical protein
MLHLKNFISFINEGAWYEGGEDKKVKRNEYITAEDRKVFLSIKNNPDNPKELLKTVEPNGQNYDIRGYKGIAPIKVYYGLYPSSIYDTKVTVSQEAKRNIMDHLKKAKSNIFSMAPGEKMEDFIKYTLLNKNNDVINIDTPINYIVRVGSSADLVDNMSVSLQKIYPDATFIDLNKIKYTDPMDGVDTDEFKKKTESEFAIERRHEKTGESLPSYSRTFTQVKAWISRMKRDLATKIANGEEPFYHIKSSGFQPGLRGVLRPKYDTAGSAFIDAVHHCAFGDENGNLAKMILIDDNTQEGIDFRNISTKIVEILAGIIDVTKNRTKEVLLSEDILNKVKSEYEIKRINRNLDNQLDDIEKSALENVTDNIFGYVLYNFGKTAVIKSFQEKFIKDELIEVAKVLVKEKLDPIKNEVVEATIKSNLAYGGSKYEYVSKYSLGLINDEYEELFNAIIKEVVDKIEERTSEDRATLEEKVKKVFYLYDQFILPIKDAVKSEVKEVTKAPRYPELAYLKDGIKVRQKTGSNEGTLVGVNQGEGKAHVLLTDGRKSLPLDLKILLNVWEVLN